MIRNLPPLVRFLLIAIAASFVITLVLPKFSYLLPVYGPVIYPGLQLWRLVTWPLLVNHLFSTIGTVLLLYYFGVELETVVHTRKLAAWLLVSVVLAGAFFTLLAPAEVLGGPEFLYFFILTGFTYLWPKREISVFGMFFVKTWIIALVIIILAIIPMNGLQLDRSAANLYPPLFAICSALLIFHIAYKQYRFGSALMNTVADNIPWRSKRIRGRDATWSDTLTVEHRIDAILDKISRKGMESLTREERDFLLKHSAK